MIAVPLCQNYQDLCRGQIDLSSVSPSIVSLMVPVATAVWIGSSSFPVVFSTLLRRRYWSLFWRRSSFNGTPWCCWWCFRFCYIARLRCCFRLASYRCNSFTIRRNRSIGDCSQVGFRHVDAPPWPLVITLFDVIVVFDCIIQLCE